MPRVRRARALPAAPDAVWAVVGDPHHLPRWWPRVARIEGADGERFTEVLMTAKGRPVRADFRRAEADAQRLVAWEQVLPGTPFERLLHSARTEVELAPRESGTEVAITQEHRLRGWARLAPFLFARATRRTLDEALDGLEAACG
jgi:uncharacterized protein YndB with AHSA1/START domain